VKSYTFDNFTVTLNKKGSSEYVKVSYPIRYGSFSEIKTREFIFQFNLNGEIKYIQGIGKNWPHPAEWLKRTVANDWLYYSADSYSGVYNFFGEYYLPCPSYSSNSVTARNPFNEKEIKSAFKSFRSILDKIERLNFSNIQGDLKTFFINIIKNNPKSLTKKAEKLHNIIGDQITVLPPDTRYVDYDVIPLIIADGCLYNCGFCTVKSGKPFSPRSKENILKQIYSLKEFYAQDIHNYNSIFLGQHDALFAHAELIEFAAKKTYEIFDIKHSNLKNSYLFIFGSVDSLTNQGDHLFKLLNNLPLYTYINIGFESADHETIAMLQKPITIKEINEAFLKMIDINKRYSNIEVTANFVLDDKMPEGHIPSIINLTRNNLDHSYPKGAIYISPLASPKDKKAYVNRKAMLKMFNQIKRHSRLPAFIYLIERL
jgi:hypothetical protein